MCARLRLFQSFKHILEGKGREKQENKKNILIKEEEDFRLQNSEDALFSARNPAAKWVLRENQNRYNCEINMWSPKISKNKN